MSAPSVTEFPDYKTWYSRERRKLRARCESRKKREENNGYGESKASMEHRRTEM